MRVSEGAYVISLLCNEQSVTEGGDGPHPLVQPWGDLLIVQRHLIKQHCQKLQVDRVQRLQRAVVTENLLPVPTCELNHEFVVGEVRGGGFGYGGGRPVLCIVHEPFNRHVQRTGHLQRSEEHTSELQAPY